MQEAEEYTFSDNAVSLRADEGMVPVSPDTVPGNTNQTPGQSGSSVKNYNYDYRPGKVKLKKAKSNKKGELSVKWKTVGTDGYQIQYALNKTFTKGKRTKNIDWLKSKITLKKLKSKKKYFVRIRAYNKKYYIFSDGYYKVYGPWSNVKKCRVK